MKITQEHLDAVLAAGACSVDRYKPGMDVGEIEFFDACWVEDNCPDLVRDIAPPLWAWCWYGYGCGAGYGCGDGFGCVDWPAAGAEVLND